MPRQTERWKDRQTLFHRPLPAIAGSPKKTIIASHSKYVNKMQYFENFK